MTRREAKTIRVLIKGAFLRDIGRIGIRDPIPLNPMVQGIEIAWRCFQGDVR